MIFDNENKNHSDEYWMTMAMNLARKAFDMKEVPVGCVIVANNKMISKASNLKEKLQTPLAHAEILAIHKASLKRKSWRLEDCTLYVTLEPCPMCAGVILQSRIKRLVFASKDSKSGSVQSLYQLLSDKRLNHQVEISAGLLAEESTALLKLFFKQLRSRNI